MDAVIAFLVRLTYDLQNLHTIIENVGQGSRPYNNISVLSKYLKLKNIGEVRVGLSHQKVP